VRKKIYRHLLLGRHVKKQRDSKHWTAKGIADYHPFEVNVLRANKAIYAEGEDRHADRTSRKGRLTDL
jgi:hypothetical protein